MAEFYLEKAEQASGAHLVHFSNCSVLPPASETLYLGSIASFESAKAKGKQSFNVIAACTECAAKYVEA